MPEETQSRRLFNEKDVGVILKRASEMQEATASTRFGLSLDELKQVAADAGIDPRHIEAAISEMDHHLPEETNFWGGPLWVAREVIVEGTIDEIAWEEIVSESRRYFKDTGEVREWSSSREWAHSGKNNVQAHVTATSRGGRTRIQLFWHEPTLAVAAYIPLLVLSLMYLPIVFEALALTGFVAGAVYFSGVALLAFIARWVMTKIALSKRRQLGDLLSRIEQIANDRAVRAREGEKTVRRDVPVDSKDTEHPVLDLPKEEPIDEERRSDRKRSRA